MWKITVRYDLDQANIGNATAVWTDTTFGDFAYSKRIQATAEKVNVFVAEAIVARNAWQVREQANVAGEVIILNKINLADPQVGG